MQCLLRQTNRLEVRGALIRGDRIQHIHQRLRQVAYWNCRHTPIRGCIDRLHAIAVFQTNANPPSVAGGSCQACCDNRSHDNSHGCVAQQATRNMTGFLRTRDSYSLLKLLDAALRRIRGLSQPGHIREELIRLADE